MSAAVLLLLAAATNVEATDFCADRPGLATGTCISSSGSVQAETSFIEWGRTKNGSEDSREYSLGATRLRIGVGQDTDIHVAFTPFIHSHTAGGGSASGVGDVSIGVKHRYVAAGSVQFAALPFLKLPVAKDPLGNGRVEFGLLMPLDVSLVESWSLTVTPEVDWNADEIGDGRHARLAVAGSIGLAVAENWSVALDGLIGKERDQSTAHEVVVGFSVAHQLRPAVQLDVEADFGLTSDVPDVRLITGFAARF